MKFTRAFDVFLSVRDEQYQDRTDHLNEVLQEISVYLEGLLDRQLGTVEKDVVVRVTVEIEEKQ